MGQSSRDNGPRNGRKLPFPFPGAIGTPADPDCPPQDPSIRRSDFGEMAQEARRKGFDLHPDTFEPCGPAFERFAKMFEYRREEPAAPKRRTARSVLAMRIRAALEMVLSLAGVAAVIAGYVLLLRACDG